MKINIKNKDFVVEQKLITKMAQEIHNEIDENGKINKDLVLECLEDKFSEDFWAWADQEIDWQKILDDDNDMRESYKEKAEAAKGEY